MSLDEKEVKEAVDLVHEYGCIKAIGGGEENQGLIDAFQTLIDLAQLYLSIAGKMPEKKEMPDFPSTQKEQSKAQWDDGFNQARQECILAFAKEKSELESKISELQQKLDANNNLDIVYLKGVEDGKEMVRKGLPSVKDFEQVVNNVWDKDYPMMFNKPNELTINKIATAIHARLEKGVKI